MTVAISEEYTHLGVENISREISLEIVFFLADYVYILHSEGYIPTCIHVCTNIYVGAHTYHT